MPKKKVLITDHVHVALPQGLRELGFAVELQPDNTLEEVQGCLSDYQGIVINSKIRISRDMLEQSPGLRFIARLGSGLEIIDLVAARDHGVSVYSAPEGNCQAVAEHALGMLLCLANHLLRADNQVRQFSWHREANRGWELSGKTVGIIGVGHTGSAFARVLRGFDLRILGHDKYREDWSADLPFVERVSREEVQAKADIVSLHLPLTDETFHYADADFLAACRPGVVLLNTARGTCVDTPALLAALSSGQVAAAGLDVFENEKPASMTGAERDLYQRLFALENVVVSPHVAGWTEESLEKIARTLLDKIRKDWEGTPQ